MLQQLDMKKPRSTGGAFCMNHQRLTGTVITAASALASSMSRTMRTMAALTAAAVTGARLSLPRRCDRKLFQQLFRRHETLKLHAEQLFNLG